MFLGKTVVHGIYALCYLSRRARGALASSAEIAQAVGVPSEHARKVLTALTSAGLVLSVRGRSGGFALARPLGEITMLDALDALNPGAGLAAVERRSCPVASSQACCVQSGLSAVREDLRALFASRTLDSVVGVECRVADSDASIPPVGVPT